MGVRSTRPRAPGWGDCWELERSRTRWVKAPPGGERSMVGAQRVRERLRTCRSWGPTGGRAFRDRRAARARTIAHLTCRSWSRTRWLSLACSSLVCLARALVVRREVNFLPNATSSQSARGSAAHRRFCGCNADTPVFVMPANHPLVVKTASPSATATHHRSAVSIRSRCPRVRPCAPSAAVCV